jgi:3'-phosphoadenosine 5'-phosphosulfate sulfotransferase
VILDYISDSLGTDEEMQVHKFAEEAMYKHIAHAILSTSSNPLHQNLSQRFKREKFAAVRTAKIRLSNLKIEELTQILRGKSKHLKH